MVKTKSNTHSAGKLEETAIDSIRLVALDDTIF